MLIPASLYGLFKDVKRRCTRVTKLMAKGVPFLQAIDSSHLIDSSQVPGLFVIMGPSSRVGGQPHFHLYFTARAIETAFFEGILTEEHREDMFSSCLSTPWGLGILLCRHNELWFSTKERRCRFLRALAPMWDVLDAEGPRFCTGYLPGHRLWDAPTIVPYVIGNSLNVEASFPFQPQPTDWPQQLLHFADLIDALPSLPPS